MFVKYFPSMSKENAHRDGNKTDPGGIFLTFHTLLLEVLCTGNSS